MNTIELFLDKSDKIKQADHSLFLSVSEQNNSILSILAEFPTKFFHSEDKVWELPLFLYQKVVDRLSELPIELIIDTDLESAHYDNILELPDGFNFKTKPYNYQKDSFIRGMKDNHFILADDVGIGKTKQAIDIAVGHKYKDGFKHCLVICCIAKSQPQWVREISKHSNETAYLLGRREKKKGGYRIAGTKEKLKDLNNLPDDYFIVVNIETLRDDDFANRLIEMVDDNEIEMIICDEVHKCKNPKSRQGSALLLLEPKVTLPLSASLIMNSPLDLYVPLYWTGYTDTKYGSFEWYFTIKDNMKQIIGFRHMDELKDMVDSAVLRRRKEDVLPDLPPRIISFEYLKMGTKQQKIYEEVESRILEQVDLIRTPSEARSAYTRLRQATAHTSLLSTTVSESIKFDALIDDLDEAVVNGHKVVVLSNWSSVIELAYKTAEKFNPVMIHGKVGAVEQDERIQKFVNDEDCHVIFGTIGVAGTALDDLKVAQTMIFLDEPWNAATLEQAMGRLGREGTTHSPYYKIYIAEGTLDELVHQKVVSKGKMSDIIIDNYKPSDNLLRLDSVMSRLIGY